MKEKKINDLKYVFLFVVFQLYIIGFFFRENLAGGAEKDFINITWPLLLAIKNDFYNTLVNYGTFREGSLPLFHILNAYFNPFIYSKIYFQGSITLISILNVIFFSQIINDKYKIKKLDALVYASIFLILPFFRSSAYWGLTENFGWLFLILSIKYFVKYENLISKKSILTVFLFCFFSSLALYVRPYMIFFPIFIIFQLINSKDYYSLKYSCIFYAFLSIPGFFLLHLWGGFHQIGAEEVSLVQDYHNPKFVIRNLIIFASIFLFYFIPWELAALAKKFKITKAKIIAFLSILLILTILSFLNIFDYLQEINLGGGVFLKLSKFLFSYQIFIFILISSIGITLLVDYIRISKKNLILFFCLLIFCFPKYPLQEYFEPLFIILLFTLMDLRKINLQLFKENKTILIYCGYFFMYFFGTSYYRHFF